MNITDNELRGIVLKKFYENRRNAHYVPLMQHFNDIDKSKEFEQEDVFAICRQLYEHGLIRWRAIDGGAGIGEIKAEGIDVVEGNRNAPIAISFITNNNTVTNGIIVTGNNNTINAQFGKEISAIDNLQAQLNNASDFTPAEKEDIKSDLEYIKKQLSKNTPNKGIVSKVWEGVNVAVTGKSLYDLVVQITPKIISLLY